MSIDTLTNHLDADYPAGLPPANAATHLGFYLAWIIDHDLIGDTHRDEAEEELERVRSREMTGREFLLSVCDGKLWDEDLSEEGVGFTQHYYSGADGALFGPFIEDYHAALGTHALPSMYHVEDTWANYDKLAPHITAAYERWK